MGFFNWFSGSSKSKLPPDSVQMDVHSTFMRQDVTRPGSLKSTAGSNNSKSASANALAERMEKRRTERNARRELLFQVVRESMVRVGILSSAFKFKVLALDQRGRTFLVMIDLSDKFGVETAKLAEIEALIALSAKTRFDMVVQAVYWRFPENLTTGAVQATPISAPAASLSGGSALQPAPVIVAPVAGSAQSATARTAPASLPRGQDPIEQDEVDAFKRALAAGVQSSISPARANPVQSPIYPAHTAAAIAAAAKTASMAAIHNKLLLTGYEDTEMHDPDEAPPVLSATQYGDLN